MQCVPIANGDLQLTIQLFHLLSSEEKQFSCQILHIWLQILKEMLSGVPLQCSVLRIPHCHCRGSGNCGMGWIPSPGIFTWPEHVEKKKKSPQFRGDSLYLKTILLYFFCSKLHRVQAYTMQHGFPIPCDKIKNHFVECFAKGFELKKT